MGALDLSSDSLIALCTMAIDLALCRLGVLSGVTQALLRTSEEGAVRNQLGVRVEGHSEPGLVGQVDTAVDGKRFVKEQVAERWMDRFSVW